MSIHKPKKGEEVKHRFRKSTDGTFTTEQENKQKPRTTIKESFIVKKKSR